MRTIHTRTYTNVALTVVILLLAALLARPWIGAPTAQAQTTSQMSGTKEEPQRKAISEYGQLEIAAATREVAASNKLIADAIKESAASQKEIARGLARLSEAP